MSAKRNQLYNMVFLETCSRTASTQPDKSQGPTRPGRVKISSINIIVTYYISMTRGKTIVTCYMK